MLILLAAATAAHAGNCGVRDCAKTSDYKNVHKLRQTIDIREVKKTVWDTHNLVPLGALSERSCADSTWRFQDGDWMFLANQQSGGDPVLTVWSSAQNKLISKVLSVHGVGTAGYETWRGSKPSTQYGDFDYYVYIADTTPANNQIDKVYRLEVFPPKGISAACDAERPEVSVDTALKPRGSGKVFPTEINSGQGGEPGHP